LGSLSRIWRGRKEKLLIDATVRGRGRGVRAALLPVALAVAVAVSCVAVVLGVQPASARAVTTKYSITDLGGGEATDINSRGQVVGASYTASRETTHAFLWEGGEMRDLGMLGGSYSVAVAINNRGQVVGYADTASGETHAVIWTK
jgi:probable HAF family extracellular repeat protein